MSKVKVVSTYVSGRIKTGRVYEYVRTHSEHGIEWIEVIDEDGNKGSWRSHVFEFVKESVVMTRVEIEEKHRALSNEVNNKFRTLNSLLSDKRTFEQWPEALKELSSVITDYVEFESNKFEVISVSDKK